MPSLDPRPRSLLYLAVSLEGSALQPADLPFAFSLRADRLVEFDRGLIPVEHGPLHPAAAALVCHAGEVQQERLPNAATTQIRLHVQVFEVEARLREKGGVGGEENREAGGRLIDKGEPAFRGRLAISGEQRGPQFLLRRFNLVQQLFVFCESTDESEDKRDIVGGGGYSTGDYWDNAIGDDTLDYSVGVGYTVNKFNLALKYVDTDTDAVVTDDVFNNEGRVIFTVATTFPWGND